ncbi:hypothetical protein TNCV_147531 [Trichonephila clavipes]|nr:hypothetical protein TNCV_147531 [Trichonephila clavipes]
MKTSYFSRVAPEVLVTCLQEREVQERWCTSSFFDFFMGLPEMLLYETPVVILDDLTARIVVPSTDIASTPDLFERVQRPCRLCYDLRGLNLE